MKLHNDHNNTNNANFLIENPPGMNKQSPVHTLKQ